MHDAGGMGRGQRPRDLRADVDHHLERRRLPAELQHRSQRLPLDELLHEEAVPVGGLADLVDDDDVRMVERRRGARLAQEAVDGALGPILHAHHFDGDGTVQPRVERAENLAHPALADALVEAIVAEGRGFHAGGARILAESALYSAP